MSINFSDPACQTNSNKKLFGLCDDSPPAQNPAYIDESDGLKWIAVVVNDALHNVTFTAIDHCIEIKKKNGKDAKRCDGVLTYGTNIVFVELKERSAKGNQWVKDAEKQLRTSIMYFKNTETAKSYDSKKAYISNSEHPKFKQSQVGRMEKFLEDTEYVLRIENRILL